MKIIINHSLMTPIYEQVVDQIKTMIRKGELKENDQLPSVRTLSKEIMDSCSGSELAITSHQIEELVRDTTMALLRAKYIFSDAGYYYTQALR